jgi:membrane protein required for colicin V production
MERGMVWVDGIIVLVIVLAALGGLKEGFFRSFCSLAGLVLGLALAAWNYDRIASLFLPVVRIEAVANAIGFLLIALFVMGVAGVAGNILSKTLHGMGMGCLDRIAGAVFGLFQGALLVMVVTLVALAFFPRAHWLAKARLPRLFFGACHFSAKMSPDELADRVRHGLNVMKEESPQWMHPGSGGV